MCNSQYRQSTSVSEISDSLHHLRCITPSIPCTFTDRALQYTAGRRNPGWRASPSTSLVDRLSTSGSGSSDSRLYRAREVRNSLAQNIAATGRASRVVGGEGECAWWTSPAASMACQPAMKHADGAVSRYMVFSHAAGMQLVDSVTECEDICLGLDFCWIDIANPTTQELLDLGEAFQLHALTVEDIVNESDRDKIDVFDDYIYIVYRAIRSTYGMSESEMLTAGSVGDDACAIASDHFAILLRENAIITIHHDARRQHTYPVISRLVAIHSAVAGDSSVLAGLTVFPPYVAYAIIDEITDHMSPRIVEIERQVDAIDELVLLLTQTEQEDMLRRIGERRRQILCMWRLVQAKPEIIHTLVRVIQSDSVLPQLGDEVAQYLGDVSDHLMAILNTCSHAETVLARAHSNYLAKISLELSRATFNSNATTERWTMLGTIVVPINIVTSFLGVNLKIPGQDRDDTLNFFIVMACMAVYTITTLAFWRWRKVL